MRTEQNSGQQKIKGAGILIVEDGDFRVTNQFDWDGVFQSSNITTLRYSQQNVDLVQQKLLSRMSTWREL